MKRLWPAAVLLLVACSSTAPASREPTADQRLQLAMCADLEDGFSLFQMHSQAVEHYRGSVLAAS